MTETRGEPRVEPQVEPMAGWKRTHSCGALRAGDAGKTVTLMGWVFRRRDHGGLIFVDIRDREGITQCVFNPGDGAAAHAKVQGVRGEFVLAVRGTVAPRPVGTENAKIPTGAVEVHAGELKVLNDCRPLPFQLDSEGDAEVDETLRLKYRYLDMRRAPVLKAFQIRDLLCRAVRDYLHEHGFLEVETPFLTRSTPEGARDFLVPSRLQPGSFYALPQSPQLFKQLLMVAGFERYFQIVRCFRDEDLRKDRQPEFTQVDIETSFLDRDDFLPIVEGLVAAIWRRVKGVELALPFQRLAYEEAMARFGSDKPDLRFGLELQDVSALFVDGEFQAFVQVVAGGGAVKALRIPGAGSMSRKELDDLTAEAKQAGAKGLVWIKVTGEGLTSPVAKFLSAVQERLLSLTGATAGDLVLLVGDAPAVAATVLGRLRVDLARRFKLIPEDRDVFAWVIDFPLVEWNADEKRWDAVHHPFTAPRDEDLPLLESDPGKVRAKAYDLVLNGQEAAGGSIRIHQQSIQERLFGLIGISKEEARARFGFLLEALEFGAPPMGGIAFGLDRLAASLVGQESIREVIAFPKTQRGACPLTDAPAPVDARQLRDLGIRIVDGAGPA
jgi:aspartyl-tRNA synthetase